MLFNSYLFILVFLPACVAVYLGLVRRGWRSLSFSWLVVASLFFYGWWKWSNLPLLIGSLVFNYTVGTRLGKMERGRGARWLLGFGVAVNLLVLGYFKYANFFIDNANAVLGSNWHALHLVLPLGISFYTFQEIAYLADSYQGSTRGYGFCDFCLFVSFFPQLIAGPIVHHSEVMPQFQRKESLPGWEDFAVGLSMFSIGLAKKVLVADVFAGYATPVFQTAEAGTAPGFSAAWAGLLAYTMQIYFDFSAYSDMAIGAARLFGIRLPLNFNSPYKAGNIADFWRRWHITLSRFLRDYLYIPLGGNRKGPLRRYVNLMTTMLLGGLWHGAGWNFVIWGALHGGYLSVFHGWQAWRERRGRVPDKPSWVGIWMGRLLTFGLVMLAWVFFRAGTFSAAWQMLGSLAGLHGLDSNVASLDVTRALRLGCWLLPVIWLLPNSHEMMAAYKPALEYLGTAGKLVIGPTPGWLGRVLNWRPSVPWAFVMAAMLVWALLNLFRPSEFIYWQF